MSDAVARGDAVAQGDMFLHYDEHLQCSLL